MYSMKRTITPVPRKRSTRSSTVWSLTPRCTTALILMGSRPARRACSMPASTSSTPPKPPLMRRKTSGSRLSRLTVMRFRPAAFSSKAYLASRTPLVVRATSSTPAMAVRSPMRSARFGAQQRLAAGQAELAHPESHEQPRQAHDLLEREALVRAEEAVAVMERLPRHAVRAAEVAAVHDRDPQIAQRPPAPVARARTRHGDHIRRAHLAIQPTTGACGSRNPWGRYWGRGEVPRIRPCRPAR